ncbi:sterile alpha motif domain-containing protein 13 isoform X3 [Caretta caretta]|uniref:sterile alpha motif domain-containing protein 13 isoform X3 n=1 Tax=Caretta caretta TaxID=8467 RepID=UPI003F4B5298
MALWMSKSYTRNPRLQTLPDLPQVFPPQRWAFQLPRCILHPIKGSVENGRPPDPADWAVTDVVNYFRTAGFEEQANAFQEQDMHCSWRKAALVIKALDWELKNLRSIPGLATALSV